MAYRGGWRRKYSNNTIIMKKILLLILLLPFFAYGQKSKGTFTTLNAASDTAAVIGIKNTNATGLAGFVAVADTDSSKFLTDGSGNLVIKNTNGIGWFNGVRMGFGALPHTSALFDLTSTTKGFGYPAMTAAQKNAIATPKTGLAIYQTTAPAGIYVYNGASWVQQAGGGIIGGADTELQFNNGGAFDGDPIMKYYYNDTAISLGDTNRTQIFVNVPDSTLLATAYGGTGGFAINKYGGQARGVNLTWGDSTTTQHSYVFVGEGTNLGLSQNAISISNTNGAIGNSLAFSSTRSILDWTNGTLTGEIDVRDNVLLSSYGVVNTSSIDIDTNKITIDGQTINFENAGVNAGTININGNTSIGFRALQSAVSAPSTAIGYLAGQNTTTGINNTIIGDVAGFSNTTGAQNAFIGSLAGYSNTTGLSNTFIGNSAGYSNTTGGVNIMLGNYAGYYGIWSDKLFIDNQDRVDSAGQLRASFMVGTMGSDSSAQKLDLNSSLEISSVTNGSASDSLLVWTTGTGLVKKVAQSSITSNSWSLTGNSGTVDGVNFIGTTDRKALSGRVENNTVFRFDTVGISSVFLGENAGIANTTGIENIAIGFGAGAGNTTGNTNIFIGSDVASSHTSGTDNIFIGTAAAAASTTNTENTIIGANATVAAGITNATAIGANAGVGQSNSLILGNSVNVGIGTGTPTAKLDVVGLTATDSLTIGGGDTITSVLKGSASLDFANQVAIGCEDLTITVTGAALSDIVSLGVPNGSVVNATAIFSAWVSAVNTVTVKYCNLVSGDPAAGTFAVMVTKIQ